MLNDHENRLRSLRFENPEIIPVNIGVLPSVWMKHREAFDDLVADYPQLFSDHTKGRNYDDVWSLTYHEGNHVDNWGCVWQNIEEGMEAIVTGHPYPTRESLKDLMPPKELTGNLPHGFMFLRLTDLRGFEEAMVDFAEEAPELQQMIDIVSEHNKKEVEYLLNNRPRQDIYTFGDDLGIQTALPVSPEKWRKYLKPAFEKIYKPIIDQGSYIYMHTDGQIYEIIPDLKDVGVSVINPQFRANGLDNLVRVCKGKICVSLDLDRQMFPFATPEEIDAHVHEAVKAMGMKEGGLWLVAEISHDIPLQNVRAIFDALIRYREYFS